MIILKINKNIQALRTNFLTSTNHRKIIIYARDNILLLNFYSIPTISFYIPSHII